MAYDLTERELGFVKKAVEITIETAPPKFTLNEKLLTAGITLIGVFTIGLIISGLSFCIAFIWNHILH